MTCLGIALPRKAAQGIENCSLVDRAVWTESARSDPASPEMAAAGVADSWHTVAHCASGCPRLQSGQ